MDSQLPFPPEIWERIPPEAQAYLRALESRVRALETTVQRLREQVQQNARTSSRPPSRDPPQAVSQRPRREPTGHRPGGPPGHEGQARALVPMEEGDVVVPIKPERCHHCQQLLQGEAPQPQRQQVTELPPMQPVVTEDPLHRWGCLAWGEETRAELPAGVPTGGFGPRVQASTALGTGASHRSKRTTQRALAALFGVQMGLGTSATVEPGTVQAVAEPVAEARAHVQRPPAASLDETGWREGQQRAWLWTAVPEWGTVFVVRASRGSKVAQARLGERCWGELVTDRWRAYPGYPSWRRQVCWAHLLRAIAAMIARGGRSRALGEALQVQARPMCQWWHRVRDGTWAPRTLARSRWPVRQEGERLLDAGQPCGVPKTEGPCRELRKRRQALGTFVRHAGGEPTHQAAERAIRPAVLWRKGRCGTQRAEGSRFGAAMMTVVATLKQHHRHVLA